jgi:hypothetical protein
MEGKLRDCKLKSHIHRKGKRGNAQNMPEGINGQVSVTSVGPF